MTDAAAPFPYPVDDPAQVREAEGTIRLVAGHVHATTTRLGTDLVAVGTGWTGDAADSCGAEVRGNHAMLAKAAQALGDAVGAVHPYLVAVEDARDTIDRIRNRYTQGLAAHQNRVTADTRATPAPPPGPGGISLPSGTASWESTAWDATVRALRHEHEQCLTDVDRAAKRTRAGLEEIGERAGVHPGQPNLARAVDLAVTAGLPFSRQQLKFRAGGGGPDGLQPPTDPTRRAGWWTLLTPAEQDRLIRTDPGRYGALTGLPAVARDTANRILLARDLATLGAKEHAGTLTAADARALAGMRQIARQLAKVEGTLDRWTHQRLQAQLLVYDPRAFCGQGRAAIVVGDLDTARNVAVTVPGFSSDVPTYLDNLTGNALNLYDASRSADPGQSTAVVAWLGYDAPGYSNVATDDAAEAGARLLAADVGSIQDSRAGNPPHLTVVGHSYGSTTTGIALANDNLRPDDVVFIGSPGVGRATHATDLHLAASHVYTGANSSDAVTYTTRIPETVTFPPRTWDPLGEDPASGEFGATRFQAEAADRGTLPDVADHSKYYDTWSESLHNIANVVTGQYSKVTHAATRPEWHGVLLGYDPEDWRTPTTLEP